MLLGENRAAQQQRQAFSSVDDQTWNTLINRQHDILAQRAHPLFLQGLETLGIQNTGVPSLESVNKRLKAKTGWQAVHSGYISAEELFDLLAHRCFPVTDFIRKPEQLDYLQEPDIFHDMFGHVPLLSEPTFADYMQLFGKRGLEAASKGFTTYLERLYWFTVEFGLINTVDGVRIYGAGIASSKEESIYSIDDSTPKRLPFDALTVLRSQFKTDQLQRVYRVVDDFAQLYQVLEQDMTPLLEMAKELGDLPVGGVELDPLPLSA